VKRRRSWKKALLAVALTLALADVALSLATRRDGLLFGRPLPPFGAITHPRQREWIERARAEALDPVRATSPGVFDREIGWTVRASYASADGRVHTNALAARGVREYPRAKPAGTLRCVFVGDSFTWGDEVADADTFEAQLEAANPRIEAINFGVAAYGTDQALLRLRRDGFPLTPDVVVVGLLLENIGRNVNRYRPLWYPASGAAPAKPRFVLANGALELVPQPFATQIELCDAITDGSVLARTAEHEHWRADPGLGVLRVSSFARAGGVWLAQRERDVEHIWSEPEAEPFRVTLALLEACVRESRAAGAQHVYVLVFPRESDARTLVDGRTAYWSALTAELAARGIPCLDLGAEIAAALRAADAAPSEPRTYSGGHLSRASNAKVARALRDRLERDGVWPR
jgi:hypothetical protein